MKNAVYPSLQYSTDNVDRCNNVNSSVNVRYEDDEYDDGTSTERRLGYVVVLIRIVLVALHVVAIDQRLDALLQVGRLKPIIDYNSYIHSRIVRISRRERTSQLVTLTGNLR